MLNLGGGMMLGTGERVVFLYEASSEQYLKVIASGALDAVLLEALDDFIKRRNRVAMQQSDDPDAPYGPGW